MSCMEKVSTRGYRFLVPGDPPQKDLNMLPTQCTSLLDATTRRAFGPRRTYHIEYHRRQPVHTRALVPKPFCFLVRTGNREVILDGPVFRVIVLVCLYFRISLIVDGPQRTTLSSCLWSLKIFSSLPGSRLMNFIAMQVLHSYNSRK